METALVTRYHTTELPDGRVLGWIEHGDPGGSPVLMFHGTPACSLDSVLDAPARAAGVRVLAVDRPGIGPSTYQPRRTLRDWPIDVDHLATALGLRQFAVLGWSGGGPYALACAAALPERVTAAGTIASICPLDRKGARQGISRLERVTITLAQRAPKTCGRLLGAAARSAEKDPAKASAQFAKGLADVDRDALDRGRAVWGDMRFFWGAFASGAEGPVHDYSIYGAPWDIDLGSIDVPVHLWHGARDRVVAPDHARRLATAIPGASLELLTDKGHLLVLDEGETILRTLTSPTTTGGRATGPG